jgi:hypothetical protein
MWKGLWLCRSERGRIKRLARVQGDFYNPHHCPFGVEIVVVRMFDQKGQ